MLKMEAAGSSEKYVNFYQPTCVMSQKTLLFKDINFKTGAVSLFRLWNAVIDTPLEAQIYLTGILKSCVLCKSFVCYNKCKALKI
jgi:hypothetical protein